MRKILLALCGTMVLMLLALSPAYAEPFYQSNLECTFNDSGLTVIKAQSGDFFVNLTTDPPVPGGLFFSCTITCGPGSASTGAVFSCGPSRASGILKVIVPNPLPAGQCLNPSVQVTGNQVSCQSGYTSP
jgi:hypothetical protein